MTTYEWTLCEPPEYRHRHYRVSVDGGKPTWNGARKQRIVSATTLLGGDTDALTAWAARQALAAGEWVAHNWLAGAAGLSGSLLSFGELALLSGMMPDQVRDAKAVSGTAAHHYLAGRLLGRSTYEEVMECPYGLRAAIDAYIADCDPIALPGMVERAVGDYELAIAGTYDARVLHRDGQHRVDLKQSNTVQGHMFAQVACYEHMGRIGGEAPSEYLTILHTNPCGTYQLYSIRTGSPDHAAADRYWRACLTKWRDGAVLNKALRP